MMRINISIALVDMVGSDNSTGPAWCNNTEEGGEEEEGGGGSLDWSGTETSWVLTSFFIGYTLFQVCGRLEPCSDILKPVAVEGVGWAVGRDVWDQAGVWCF